MIQTDNTKNAPAPKTFTFICAADLVEQEFEPLTFAVDTILPSGIFILAGNGKIGKSWLALDMCVAIASGGSVWDFSATPRRAMFCT